jgi:hypothetical protein
MLEKFYIINDLIHKDSVFWICALSGSGLFIFQLILNFLGGDQDSIDDGGGEQDAGNFKWLSKQALIGFLMIFGWTGLTCRKEFDLSILASVTVSLIGGLITIGITGLIFKGAKKLRSSGTVFRIEDTIGKEATIYQRIPKGGIGKISLSLYNFTYEIDAISPHPDELLSFTSVQIIKKADENTVVVIPTK